ncbi:MAG: hypothetical protein HN509_16955 [Halobacteriovoraceae bacterium]|nr:hypothetical protein [Halobacteriovoraceae bacterium]
MSFANIIRSYPTAFALQSKAGYGLPIWGKGGSGPLYGYLRPSLQLQTSGVINSFGGQFDFFPISFLGAYGGSRRVYRNASELQSFDCTLLVCKSTVGHQYLGAKMALALGPLFLVGDLRVTRLDVKDKSRAFADETSTLIGSNGADTLRSFTTVLGFKVNESLKFGVLGVHNKMLHTPGETTMAILFGQKSFGEWEWLVGPGLFRGREKDRHLTVFSLLKWVPQKGLPLF